MSSIVTAVFQATIGLLLSKVSLLAEKLKDVDVTDEKFRGLIVREIDDIKSKLDGLSRKDLLASISFFKEGIHLLYEVFYKIRSRSEAAQAADAEAVPVAEGMRSLELTSLDESAIRVLLDAKERFKDARRKATEAFNNEALETSHRILAMQFRVMATILEKVDNPANAVGTCRVCIEELHCLSAVQECFNVELRKGLWARFGKQNRREIIAAVYLTNRAVYDVMQTVGFIAEPYPIYAGVEEVDPLRDERLIGILNRLGIDFQAPQEILVRGPLAVQAYQKALLEGKTRVMRVPIMFIGQGQSGKTSLKKSLKGERFDPNEKSTVGIEMDPSYCRVSTEAWKLGKKTKETDSEQVPISYEQRTAQYMLSDLKKERRRPTSSHVVYENVIVDNCPSTVDDKEQFSDFDDAPRIRTPEVSRDTPLTITEVPNVPEVSKVPEEIAGMIEKLHKAVDNEQNEEDIYSVLWDFGGQSVYYTLHPLFLTPRAIYCLVFNLSRKPDEIVSPQVKQGFYKVVEDVFCERKNMDYLDFWMSSVSSLVSQDEDREDKSASEILPERLPPVFLVCTHADKPYQSAYPEELGREIFGSLQEKDYGKHLLDVFVVDNTKSASGQECPEVTRLRKKVLDVAKDLPQMKELIPIKWLKFEKAVRVLLEEGKKWIFLDEAKKIALEVCGISSNEQFLALLNFLHDQRILIHFNHTPELNKMVILDPQWLVDVVKKVITITPYKPEEKKFQKAWERLETEGVLEKELLQHVWGPLFDNKDTCSSLITMMEKFCLLCPWPISSEGECSSEYLVPSMLKFPPKQDVSELIASSGMPSLFVKFKSGQVPPGLFPRLVLMVFQWCTKEWLCQAHPQLHYNFARFYHPSEGCSLILHCHSSFIEVVVHKQSESESSYDPSQVTVARTVCRQLGLIFECMRKEFPWCTNMAYEMSVCCPVCCKQGSVIYCSGHNVRGCKKEECLHFWTETQLRECPGPIVCIKSAVASNNRVPRKLLGHWFNFVDDQRAFDGSDGRALPCKGGDLEQALTLPSGVLEALQLQRSNADDVVTRLQESLSLDQASLEQPEPETKRWIRFLCMKAKTANRLDVVKKLRQIAPDGTTGPLLNEALDVRKIPSRQRRELTMTLSGGDEWKLLAERLNLTNFEIRYYDKRVENPCDVALAFSRNQGYITSVGDLYDKLVDCELPLIADLL